MTKQSSPALSGIIVPLVTPLAEGGELDHAGLSALIEHVIDGGVTGVFILGTTGEGPALGHSLRMQFVEQTAQLVAGRASVIVGVTDPSLAESLLLAEHAEACGATALAAAPPYYFPLDQIELRRYYEELARESPLPLLLYNIPQLVRARIAPTTVAALTAQRNIVGLKDSSGDLEYFAEVRRLVQRPDFCLLMGSERLLGDGMTLGARGGVCGGANLFPRWFVDWYEALDACDDLAAGRLARQVALLEQTIYAVSTSSVRAIQGLKAALAELGICRDTLCPPFAPLSTFERAQLRRHLAALSAAPARPY